MSRRANIGVPEARGVRRLRPMLGTLVAIEASGTSEGDLQEAIGAAYGAVEKVERLLHPEKEQSDLAAIHRGPPKTPVNVHSWTLEVLKLSRLLWERSDGIFDPCLPDAPGTMSDLSFNAAGQVIAQRSVHIDLGGIAKGFAIDRAVAALQARGCNAGLVNAGGDVRVFGSHEQTIVIRATDHESIITLRQGAIAVSDPQALAKPREHRGYYRRDSAACEVSAAVLVRAEYAALADALTKCLLLGERNKAQLLLDAFGASGEVLTRDV